MAPVSWGGLGVSTRRVKKLFDRQDPLPPFEFLIFECLATAIIIAHLIFELFQSDLMWLKPDVAGVLHVGWKEITTE